jgi:signal transduction histidine kinase
VKSDGKPYLRMLASYGNANENGYPERLEIGQGFIGQCALDKRRILVTNVPQDTVPVGAVMFSALPRSVVVLPVIFEGQIKAVIGIASLESFFGAHLAFLDQLTSSVGIVLNSIEATMQTEGLLQQSQQAGVELQTQQKELQQTNEQLGLKAQQLAEQKRRGRAQEPRDRAGAPRARGEGGRAGAHLQVQVRVPREHVARAADAAEQHLILGQQLGDNPEGNLTPKQVEFARTIHGAGSDLLTLITDILDLSKIESGTVTVEAQEVSFASLQETVRRSFLHEAETRGLRFEVRAEPALADAGIFTDSKRLLQVLKNLLSNAFKFTEHGGVDLAIGYARGGWSGEHPCCARRRRRGLRGHGHGRGHPVREAAHHLRGLPEATRAPAARTAARASASPISRELASLLGGEIQLRSTPRPRQRVHAVPAAALCRSHDRRPPSRRRGPRRRRS